MLTKGSVENSKIPESFPDAADLYAWLTEISSIFESKVATKSATDTDAVGTLNAMPCTLPFNSGITLPTAFAAPVVVGIIFIAAALALRGSLCLLSKICWSFVYECIVVFIPCTTLKLS